MLKGGGPFGGPGRLTTRRCASGKAFLSFGLTRANFVTSESAMAKVQAEIRALAERIQALADADRAKILAQVMQAEGKRVPWSAVQRVQGRVRSTGLRGEKVDRDIVDAVREVRRDRARKSRG